MGGIMMPPPPPMNTTTIKEEGIDDDDDNESVSDIISIDGGSTAGDVKEVKVRRGRKSKKTEINL